MRGAVPSKTTHVHDFFELSPGQFEDLVRSLIATMPNAWTRSPEPLGRLGADRGRDIRVTERVGPALWRREREWLFQVKREKHVGAEDLRKIVGEAVPDKSKAPYALVVVVASAVSNKAREAFAEEARKARVKHAEVWDRNSLNTDLLRTRNGRTAAFYFGAGAALEGTTHLPLALDRSLGRDAQLGGRDALIAKIKASPGDIVVIGGPGVGKTRLTAELEGARYLAPLASPNEVTESLRDRTPAFVVVDDAGWNLDRLRMMLDLRREGWQFRLVATVWPDHLPSVRRELPNATEIVVEPLDRKSMDDFIQALGVRDYFWRHSILEQAQGRPGWAVALVQLGFAGHGEDVASGRALVREIERLVGPSPARVIGLMAAIATLGRVNRARDLPKLEHYLGISQLESQELLGFAAAAGILDAQGDALLVAPNALRIALVRERYFEDSPAVSSSDRLLDEWPDRRPEILASIVEVAASGSVLARRALDRVAPDVLQLPLDALQQFVALDEQAAERALRETDHLPLEDYVRRIVVTTSARRHLSARAVHILLDSAIGDARPEHSFPDHPIRLLGEMGSRITPRGETTFPVRLPLMDLVDRWLDADASNVARQVVWARLVVHLLDPSVEGGHTDPGSPRTLQLSAGTESEDHLTTLTEQLWPKVEARVPHLSEEALVELARTADHWIRLSRRVQGSFGHIPPEAAGRLAARFIGPLLSTLSEASADKPAAQLALRSQAEMFGMARGIKLDRELRILTWDVWRRGSRNRDPIGATLRKLVACWAEEDPRTLMTRLAGWSAAAEKAKQQLPQLQPALGLLSDQAVDLDPYIEGGLDGGLTWELYPMMLRAIERQSSVPAWLTRVLAIPSGRKAALQAMLDADGNEQATTAVLSELTAGDLDVVEIAMVRRSGHERDEVCHRLLTHPVDEVRGTAALWFATGSDRHGAQLPPEWGAEWAAAFECAPLLSGRGTDNYRLGEHLKSLIARDPDLVERWLLRQLARDPAAAQYRLPVQSEAALSELPHGNRERIVRAAPKSSRLAVLSLLIDDQDQHWLAPLIDDGTLETDEVVIAARRRARPLIARVRQTTSLGTILVPRDVSAHELAACAMFGGWAGNESDNYEELRKAFDDFPPLTEPNAEAVRKAGVEQFATRRDAALKEERRRLVTGEL
jgi:hypothetical protein